MDQFSDGQDEAHGSQYLLDDILAFSKLVINVFPYDFSCVGQAWFLRPIGHSCGSYLWSRYRSVSLVRELRLIENIIWFDEAVIERGPFLGTKMRPDFIHDGTEFGNLIYSTFNSKGFEINAKHVNSQRALYADHALRPVRRKIDPFSGVRNKTSNLSAMCALGVRMLQWSGHE